MTKHFEPISYTQTHFRKLLDCMSRPGKINVLDSIPSIPSNYLYSATLGIGLTLLDQEAGFHILEDDGECTSFLQLYTMAKSRKIEECDYLFLQEEQYVNIERLKKGTVAFPDESTTIICQVYRLASQPIEKRNVIQFILKGPGIQSEKTIYISGLHEEMLPQWQEINKEFPLGVDWIIVDAQGNVCCIPRSTLLKWRVL